MATNISEFRADIIPDIIGCPPIAVDQAVVKAIIQLCKDAQLFQQAFEHSVDASADVDTDDNDAITITVTDYLAAAWKPERIRDLKIDGAAWDTSYFDLENDVDDMDYYTISGVKFFNFPSVTTIKIFPMDTTDDVLLFLNLDLVPLETMTSIDDKVYQDLTNRQAVESYAKYLLLRQPRKEWTDPAMAEFFLSRYSEKMETAKVKRLHGLSYGSLRVKSLRFF